MHLELTVHPFVNISPDGTEMEFIAISLEQWTKLMEFLDANNSINVTERGPLKVLEPVTLH
jgi:hypothetical protein